MSHLMMDNCDAAFIGLAIRCGQEPIAVYELDKLIAVHVAMGMTEDEAGEFIDFNILGAWVGDNTPLILRTMTAEESREEAENDE